VLQVPGARVVVANYGALLSDFKESFGPGFRVRYAGWTCRRCAARGAICFRAIDRWIVDAFALVSEAQAAANDVNSPIAGRPSAARAHRPPGYGRALIVEVPGEGASAWADIKGAGVAPGRQPRRDYNANGLEYLGLALADFFYAWLADRIFADSGYAYRTLPIYAVLDLGFDIVDGWAGTGPAGLHVRRARPRPRRVALSGSDEERVALHVELLLRSYGLTTAHAGTSFAVAAGPGGRSLHYGGSPVRLNGAAETARADALVAAIGRGQLELSNIQLTEGADWPGKKGCIVDIGSFDSRNRFRWPFATAALDRIFRIGHVVSPGDRAFVQPHPAKSVDAALFNRVVVNAQCLHAANAFRRGRLTGLEVARMLRRAVMRAGVGGGAPAAAGRAA